MNKSVFVAAAAAALLFTAGAAVAQTVRIGTEGAYAPWNFLDDSGNPAGYEIDLGNDLCTRAGLTCEWVINEWDSMIPNLQAGNYDAIMAGMSITEERQQSIDFTQEYFPPDPSKFLTASGASFAADNPSGIRIGVQGATIQAAYAEANFAGDNTILSFETADQALADLNAGNLDAILADGAYIDELIASSGGSLQTIGEEIAIGGGVGVGLRKQDDDLEQKLNDAITAAKADGTVDELIAKWFPEKTGGPFFQ
jgi:polar amino acid transport system substrate-binding protein